MIFARKASDPLKFTFLLQGFLLSSSLSVPNALNLVKFDSIHMSEAPEDFGVKFPEDLFSGAMDYEWARAKAFPSNPYPFIVCDATTETSGYDRLEGTIQELNTTTGEKVWLSVIYNKDDITCFTTALPEPIVISTFEAWTEERKEKMTAQPISQSMKMTMLSKDEIQRQIENDGYVRILAFPCPGIIESGIFTAPALANSMLDSFRGSPGEVSSSSFFHQLSQQQAENSNNATHPVLTTRILFWSKQLDEGFNTGDGCSNMLSSVNFEVFEEDSFHTLQFNVKNSESTPACVWSLFQGIALDPNICITAPKYKIGIPMPPPQPTPVASPTSGAFLPYYGSVLFITIFVTTLLFAV